MTTLISSMFDLTKFLNMDRRKWKDRQIDMNVWIEFLLQPSLLNEKECFFAVLIFSSFNKHPEPLPLGMNDQFVPPQEFPINIEGKYYHVPRITVSWRPVKAAALGSCGKAGGHRVWCVLCVTLKPLFATDWWQNTREFYSTNAFDNHNCIWTK